jgi:hypothetical protein
MSCTVYDEAALGRARTAHKQRDTVIQESRSNAATSACDGAACEDAHAARGSHDSSRPETDATHDDEVQTDSEEAGLERETARDAAARGERKDAAAEPSDSATRADARSPDAEVEEESGYCGACNSAAPSQPVLNDSGGTGNVTSYGSVMSPTPSTGGACNYGALDVRHYAAINVDVEVGDAHGQWQGGRICGQCAAVSVKTPDGWKETIVRIVDKCSDPHCGIALSGAAARELMGDRPGRYDGRWRFVSCAGQRDVSDARPSLRVKEGSSTWWALLHVRNPPQSVTSIDWQSVDSSSNADPFAYATEAENFYSVPEAVHNSGRVRLTIHYRDDSKVEVELPSRELARPGADITLP